jgi:glycosyltransferase involved in cell wall biosynthesis
MMNAADCLLLTSITEGSPNVVKEALMCGLPVVTTHVGDVEELLRDVSPSWICEASADAIAEALVECLRGPRRSNGRSKSMHLGVRPIAERILSVYATALSDASDDPAHARNGRSHTFRSAS